MTTRSNLSRLAKSVCSMVGASDSESSMDCAFTLYPLSATSRRISFDTYSSRCRTEGSIHTTASPGCLIDSLSKSSRGRTSSSNTLREGLLRYPLSCLGTTEFIWGRSGLSVGTCDNAGGLVAFSAPEGPFGEIPSAGGDGRWVIGGWLGAEDE